MDIKVEKKYVVTLDEEEMRLLRHALGVGSQYMKPPESAAEASRLEKVIELATTGDDRL